MRDSLSDEQLADAVRRVIEWVRSDADALFAHVDRAVLRSQAPDVAADPVLSAAIRRSVRSNITAWLDGTYAAPFTAVAANDGLEVVAVAREFRRRGLEEDSIAAFRSGQAAAWERWVEAGSQVLSDPQELNAFLTFSARSIFAFIDATTAAIENRLEGRRRQVHDVDQVQALVSQLLDHGSVDLDKAQLELRYRFDREHLAAILWTEQLDGAEVELDRAVDAIQHHVDGGGLLQAANGGATRWIWLPTGPSTSPGQVISAVRAAAPAVCVACGLPASGLAGFRRSHEQALAAQRVIAASGLHRSADWGELELVALLTGSPSDAREFIARTLGELASADPELRETVRTYLHLGGNATRTADALFAHRNTIIGRIKRADALLPLPIAANGMRIACALEAARWLPAA